MDMTPCLSQKVFLILQFLDHPIVSRLLHNMHNYLIISQTFFTRYKHCTCQVEFGSERISPSGETGIPTFEALAEWLWLETVWVGGKFFMNLSIKKLRRVAVLDTMRSITSRDRLVLRSSDPCASPHFDRALLRLIDRCCVCASASFRVGRNSQSPYYNCSLALAHHRSQNFFTRCGTSTACAKLKFFTIPR